MRAGLNFPSSRFPVRIVKAQRFFSPAVLGPVHMWSRNYTFEHIILKKYKKLERNELKNIKSSRVADGYRFYVEIGHRFYYLPNFPLQPLTATAAYYNVKCKSEQNRDVKGGGGGNTIWPLFVWTATAVYARFSLPDEFG